MRWLPQSFAPILRRSAKLAAAGLLLVTQPISAPPAMAQASATQPVLSAASHPYAPHVADAARRFGIPEAWIWAVMRVESGGNARAVSRAGAMGLMQIMPATWAQLRARHGLGADPFDVRDNIMAGAAYLREMHDRYGNPSAMLAAYNAGPGRYDEHLSRGRPLPVETVAYLARLETVTGTAGAVDVAIAAPPDRFAWRRSALFVRTANTAPDADSVQPVGEVIADDPPSLPPERRGQADAISTRDAQVNGLFVPRTSAGRP